MKPALPLLLGLLLAAPAASQELPPAESDSGPVLDTWGAGRMHATGSFGYDSTDFDSTNTSVDTLALGLEYGYLLDQNWEVNGRVSWLDKDAGATDSTLYGLLAGARYYVMGPTARSPVAVYGGARAGIVGVDLGPGSSSTDPAVGADGGVIWWPWGYGHGLAVDLRLDYLYSSEIDRFGVFAGIGFWW